MEGINADERRFWRHGQQDFCWMPQIIVKIM
ncbi:hypothetical protein P308_08290 [Pseudomonas piscis]|nr:hypothetical protein P308_08290 [Pseudomonas piscis]